MIEEHSIYWICPECNRTNLVGSLEVNFNICCTIKMCDDCNKTVLLTNLVKCLGCDIHKSCMLPKLFDNGYYFMVG